MAVKSSKTFEVQYSLEDTAKALETSIERLKGFEVHEIDYDSYMFYVKVNGSFWSWGEKVKISLERLDSGTEVHIKSVPTIKTTLIDYGKNKRNVNNLYDTLCDALTSYPKLY